MKTRVFWTLLVMILAVTGLIMTFAFNERDVTDNTENNTDSITYNKMLSIHPVKLPQKVNFAGEEVPLDKFYVQEQLDREMLVNTYWHSSTILMMKRANRWFPVIEPILKENQIPGDFKYIGLVESSFTNIVSPAGAAGFWQFMEGTAREYGLIVNKEVDERYNLEKATRAACDYFKDAFAEYRTWTMAAASYNSGINLMNRETARQETMNYYDLYLNEETSRYIFRAIAIHEIMENPEQYGFYLNPEDLYKPLNTRQIKVDSSIPDLVKFAKDQGITFRMLKEYNPWLIDTRLTIEKGCSFMITLPSV
jgi:membrane-bound lytic murein transglycosylase D